MVPGASDGLTGLTTHGDLVQSHAIHLDGHGELLLVVIDVAHVGS